MTAFWPTAKSATVIVVEKFEFTKDQRAQTTNKATVARPTKRKPSVKNDDDVVQSVCLPMIEYGDDGSEFGRHF